LFNIFRRKVKRIKVEDLKKTVVEEMREVTIEIVKGYSKEKGEVCFIAYEYFYDGGAIDIGLRVGLDEERFKLEQKYGTEADIRENTGAFTLYKPLLREDACKKNANILFQCMRSVEKDNHGSVYKTIKEIANTLTEKVKDVLWNEYAAISDDFTVLGPFEYD
jgi:hypothetical protein